MIPGWRRLRRVFVCTAVLSCRLPAADSYPSATISNGQVEARLYLPDAERGSYRGTRFDWSGIIASLKWNGHEYFGQWYAKHDPLVHDAITGPVDIFDTNGAGLGYAEAAPGLGFIRIGVGVVEKPNESAYQGTHTYRILDPGRRTIRRTPNSISFTQKLSGPGGYAYSYSKTVSLTPGRPEMVISYQLRNDGTKPIVTTVFNHGFFQLDGEPAGPGLTWSFPWQPKATGDLTGMAEIRGSKIAYTRELRDGERLMTVLTGYGNSAADHQFSVENTKTGAGVRVIADQPIMKLNFWSRRMAYAPEAYVQFNIPPGTAKTWQTKYEFYSTQGKH